MQAGSIAGLGSAKTEKDLRQAAVLLQLLARKRPFELRLAWEESTGRGRKWRQLIEEGLTLLDAEVQATVRRVTSE